MILQWYRSDSILLRQISFAMKKRILTILAGMTALSLSLASCTDELADNTYPDEETSTESSRLRIHVPESRNTRSSINPDEDRISSICVMAYRKSDGILAAFQTGTGPEDIDMELTGGKYNIYITANMDGFQVPPEEKELPSVHYAIESFSQMEDVLPMCWKGEAELTPGKSTTILADLSRLVSKTGLKIDMGSIRGMDIRSVRLCQGARKIWPFMDGGSRIDAPSDAIDSDYANEEDIKKLMAGETVWLYAAENCQGTLMPDNTDPWSKVPDNIGNSAELCTYVEMNAQWTEEADFEGTVTYRFYLGEDSTSDFNIRRNTISYLTLYLEEGSLGKINWKVDSSKMNPIRWSMSSTLENNYHDKEDFYMTENIRIDFSFDDDGRRYWQKRDNSFIIAGIGENGNTVIRFRELVNLGDGHFYAIGTCEDSGYYDIVLIDGETEEIKYFMEQGEIKIPGVIAGPSDFYADTPVKGFGKERSLYINRNEVEVCLYMTDSNGYNLNQGHYYGCDFTLQDWNISILSKSSGNDLKYGTLINMEVGDCGNDSYAAKYKFSMENDGKVNEWNRKLTESLGPGMLTFTFEDSFSKASCNTTMGLYCEDIEITLMCVPDSHRPYLQSEFMYAVENPSNLPINVRGLKLNSMEAVPLRSDVNAVACDPIPGFSGEVPLLVSRMPYTCCSLENNSAKSEMIGGRMCFAADDDGIEQSHIPRQLAMFHTLEVEFAYASNNWMPETMGHINLYDTDEHIRTYGSDGYMNCGMAFYAGDDSNIIYDGNNGISTDFQDYGDLLSKEYIKKFNDIIEVNLSINGNNEIVASTSRQADLRISVSGNLNGHIRCVTVRDPLFTLWGRYFTDSVPFSNSETFSLGNEASVIDAGALAEAFVKMRQIEYYSVVDALNAEEFRVNDHQSGTIREYLKPYGIDMSIEVSSSDGTPVAISFSGSAVYDYKISDPVTWSTGISKRVTMVPSSYSEFDKGLEDNGCPPGALFKAETIYLQPNLTLNSTPGLYYMSR